MYIRAFHIASSSTQLATPIQTSQQTIAKETPPPQRVQIMRTPDGRITVKGLLPGQQLVQYPDGKLHVLTSAQLQTGLTPVKSQVTPSAAVKTAVKQAIQHTPTGIVACLILQ